MSKVTVTSNWKIIELVDRFIDSRTQDRLGETVVDAAKQMISEGQSPVQGYGRFERYKDRTKYPGGRKDARPVNLYLSGDMLGDFDYKKTDDGVAVGMVRGVKTKEIAGYHQDGTPNMAQRRFVPGDGEEWAITIMRKIADVWGKRFADLIRQSNRKE